MKLYGKFSPLRNQQLHSKKYHHIKPGRWAVMTLKIRGPS